MQNFLGLIAFCLWIYALIQDASHNALVWLLLDLFIPPIGVLHGLVYLFS